ncbi:hypothetical protein BK026_18685 [Alteromonas sp. V450]|uniref:beta-ribofuranosylaminobenzene 5'-phosphate synthase family protein n=1 Tax=Alteromonas sp. V450 TaxID=1912139 RepID=UPI00091A5650|nr:beta-ribofuranosylaminobenzene 5'-phosphate synthase family protein [Alteromonas sp. V450]OJF70633.1 hypothetical protein BK026_18685 [Alteromonas sp. V450]
MQNLKINIPSRVHLNLIAMHECDFRRNGGLGFSVDTGLVLYAEKIERIKIDSTLPELKPLAMRLEKQLLNIKNELKLNLGIHITLANELPPHIGLGSGTSITLAAIEALLLINEYDYSVRELQKLSGRGGTSGVGIHSYFCGGFVYDLGVKANSEAHLPSSHTVPNEIPSLLFRNDYPFGNIIYLYPKHEHKNHGVEEYNFFLDSTPITDIEAYKACYSSIFEVTASLVDGDQQSFFRAIEKIKETKWKTLEVEHSGTISLRILSELEHLNIAGFGMSSMGPGIFILSEPDQQTLGKIIKKFNLTMTTLIPNNRGRTINYA